MRVCIRHLEKIYSHSDGFSNFLFRRNKKKMIYESLMRNSAEKKKNLPFFSCRLFVRRKTKDIQIHTDYMFGNASCGVTHGCGTELLVMQYLGNISSEFHRTWIYIFEVV